MATDRSGGSMLGFGWESIGQVRRKSEKTKIALTNLNKTFIYWMEDDEGGVLTKKAANEFSQYLKRQIYAQQFDTGGGITEEFTKRIVSLSDEWQRMKSEAWRWGGQALDERIGIATGQMINAIRPIDMGGGRWRVGISGNDYVTWRIGTVQRIATYAKFLEFGTVRQPPRPIFSTIFLQWVNKELPKFIYDTIYRDMRGPMMDLYQQVAESRPTMQAEDMYGYAAPGEPGDVSARLEDQADEIIRRADVGKADYEQEYADEYYESEESQAEPTWYSEAERTEEYITKQLGEATLHITEASGDIWNWIDNAWQDAETAIARLQMYGEL